MKTKKVTVKYMFKGEISTEFPDKGVFYPDRGLVLSCDSFGAVSIYHAKPVESEDAVIVAEGAEDLLNDNADLFIDLVMSGGAAE